MAVAQTRIGGRAGVLNAAIDNFTVLGYHGTSMRDIARATSMTVASIYHYFPSKQEILQEIMTSTMNDVIALTRAELLNAGSEPADQLEALVHAWILFHTSRQREALIGSSELRSLEQDGRAVVVRLRDEQERMFRDVIVRGVEMGVFATPYPRDAARAVINMGYSIAWWYHEGGGVSPEDMAKRYVDIALGVVRAVPRR
ncbi:TetR family transcriptional regulator [Nocardioides sp. LHD-245]|uniref:TetR family transcriptional regulator n=1 Tax=Nocardioides sp. LHD-245 TaxID=3051387 RepID=UPI0027E0F929|nr:TetR family transcriptional regulator [Nocardioides sp. LHD-245]